MRNSSGYPWHWRVARVAAILGIMPLEIRYSDGSIHEGRTISPDDVRLPEISGADLTSVRIDLDARLWFGDVEVTIGTACVFLDAGTETRVDEDFSPLATLYPGTLDRLTVDSDATLRLAFKSGATIIVPAHEQWEAWQIAGPGSRGPGSALIVCGTSGSSGLDVSGLAGTGMAPATRVPLVA